ncbi:4-methylaminobutanoate oxidase (formaldehyde-forming) [Chitinophaga niastensis]|uniref:4-methylaminobutanoate oxidase (Formaldehyde-forming) n=1 Tax=Chitinophaga niastensis TaxID=536980 RepID=A0A2P8HDN9_CHINA|nr:FAD-binding oxidoreductase [Chitinophaga niastensis]PSL44322.1 4-methylaminobutanoate oxidase (formaldehyde-forming) [Chitinophaga niastensis]
MNNEKADVVIIGGGIFGCAIAYYYTRDNPGEKIIVLERNELCNAATSRAAALMTRIRSKKAFIPLSLETYNAVTAMEQQLGESMDVKTVGVMHVAAEESSVKDLEVLMSIATEFGEPATYITAGEAHNKAPWLKTDEAIRIGYMPGEAYCDPYLLGTFYARCAKMQGADIRQGVEVTSLLMEGNVAAGVHTKDGVIRANKVIVAAGAWAPLFAAQAGIGLPMAPVRSQYWITEKAPEFRVDAPIVLLPDAQAYARPEGGSLLFGIREKNSFSASPKEIPAEINSFSFSPDKGMQDLSEVIDRLTRFFPAVYETGLKYYVAGFSGYTPDNNLTMGAAHGIANLLLATGCVGAGIAVSGGVGHAFAEMAAGRPNPYDFSSFDINRFGEIDPFSQEWLDKCARARSAKKSG